MPRLPVPPLPSIPGCWDWAYFLSLPASSFSCAQLNLNDYLPMQRFPYDKFDETSKQVRMRILLRAVFTLTSAIGAFTRFV